MCRCDHTQDHETAANNTNSPILLVRDVGIVGTPSRTHLLTADPGLYYINP